MRHFLWMGVIVMMAGCASTAPSVVVPVNVPVVPVIKKTAPLPIVTEEKISLLPSPLPEKEAGLVVDNAELMGNIENNFVPYLARKAEPEVNLGVSSLVVVREVPRKQYGVGSWYGHRFHGRKTSSGERYNMYKLTAAHRTLPIPSYARVVNVENGKQVIVRVNDRGPFHGNRIIDLSFAAAQVLGYVKKGSAQLEIEPLLPIDLVKVAAPGVGVSAIDAPAEVKLNRVYIQLGSYGKLSYAQGAMYKLEMQWPVDLPLLEIVRSGKLYRIYSGPYEDRLVAQAVLQKIETIGKVVPFIVER
jgi:rare lipoprotein A